MNRWNVCLLWLVSDVRLSRRTPRLPAAPSIATSDVDNTTVHHNYQLQQHTAYGRWRGVNLDQRCCSTLSPVSTGMGDHLQAGKSSRYVASHLGWLSLLPSVGGGVKWILLTLEVCTWMCEADYPCTQLSTCLCVNVQHRHIGENSIQAAFELSKNNKWRQYVWWQPTGGRTAHIYTLCSEKNTHSHFLSYLHELFVDLNKNCSEYT